MCKDHEDALEDTCQGRCCSANMRRNTKAELVQKQQEELDELSSGGILYEVTQAVLERTWKVVQEQVGEGSSL